MQVTPIKPFRGHAHAHSNPFSNGTWEYLPVEAVGIVVHGALSESPMYLVNLIEGEERKPGFAYVIDADETTE